MYVHNFLPFICMHILCNYLDCITVPGPPFELKYKVSSDTTANISWSEPEEPNGVILSYVVEYGELGENVAVREEVTTPQYMIQNLGTNLELILKL